jgi:hypothetical protein
LYRGAEDGQPEERSQHWVSRDGWMCLAVASITKYMTIHEAQNWITTLRNGSKL